MAKQTKQTRKPVAKPVAKPVPAYVAKQVAAAKADKQPVAMLPKTGHVAGFMTTAQNAAAAALFSMAPGEYTARALARATDGNVPGWAWRLAAQRLNLPTRIDGRETFIVVEAATMKGRK